MKKAIFFIVLVLFFFSMKIVYSQEASLKEVKEVAKNFYWEQTAAADKSLKYDQITPEIVYIEKRNNKNIYYVVNLPNSNAHVYVTSDKRIKAVLGYGEGLYNESDIKPPAYTSWMESYTREIDLFDLFHNKSFQDYSMPNRFQGRIAMSPENTLWHRPTAFCCSFLLPF